MPLSLARVSWAFGAISASDKAGGGVGVGAAAGVGLGVGDGLAEAAARGVGEGAAVTRFTATAGGQGAKQGRCRPPREDFGFHERNAT